MNSALYAGNVFHKRFRPTEHELNYRVFSLLLNLDELDALQKRLWLFSYNRWNLFSFYDKDFGENAAEPLVVYVKRKLVEAGIEEVPEHILLSCYPRVCGHSFNPISLFYCLDKNNQPIAILHEVHNTFGERHTYTLKVDDAMAAEGSTSKWIRQSSDKLLFVSPFAHTNMHYDFKLNVPGERQVLLINAHDEEGHLITASYSADRHQLTGRKLLRYFFTMPVLGAKVVLGIHWEAVRLWMKKVPLYPHQRKQLISVNKQKNHL